MTDLCRRQISMTDGQKFADENGFDVFIEVSAKTGRNIELVSNIRISPDFA